jgi:hypothetical protein
VANTLHLESPAFAASLAQSKRRFGGKGQKSPSELRREIISDAYDRLKTAHSTLIGTKSVLEQAIKMDKFSFLDSKDQIAERDVPTFGRRYRSQPLRVNGMLISKNHLLKLVSATLDNFNTQMAASKFFDSNGLLVGNFKAATAPQTRLLKVINFFSVFARMLVEYDCARPLKIFHNPNARSANPHLASSIVYTTAFPFTKSFILHKE